LKHDVKIQRILIAAVLASACAVFIRTVAYTDFTGLRVRVVKDPIAAGSGRVGFTIAPEKLRGLAAPFAVVANLRNDSASAVSIRIRLDERDVCAPVVPPGRSMRVDCQFGGPWDPAVDHQATLTSESTPWKLDAFELSTHHGSNAAFVRAYVLPLASHAYGTPGPLTCAAIALLLFALMLVPAHPLRSPLRISHRAVVAFFALWATGVLLVPFVSSYRVIVSANTVKVWLILCLAPQIYRVAKGPALAAIGWLRNLGAVPRALIVAALAVVCFAVVVERRVAVEYSGNYSGLLALSRERVEANPWLQERQDVKVGLIAPDNAGYDGQFMYAIAFDPFARRFHDQPRAYVSFIDMPPYRYSRVGYPLISRLLALGRPERFPGAMVVTIYAGVFLAAVALGWLAWRSGGSVWWGLSIALVPGFWDSFRAALPEPVAAGAVIAGYLLVRERRLIPGAVLLAAACLIRETSVFFVLCVAGWLAWSKQPREALKLLVIALGPLSLWRLYIGFVFAPGWGLEAFWNPPDDFGAPFAGIAALWSDLAAGRYYPDFWEMRRGIMSFSIIVIAGAALSWMMVRLRPGPVTAAAAIFGAMAICFNLKNVWVGTGNAERLTCDLFFCLALATPEFVSRSRSWRTALITFWCAVAAYLLFGTIDASFTRESLMAALLGG
jgi:hypothetical protein